MRWGPTVLMLWAAGAWALGACGPAPAGEDAGDASGGTSGSGSESSTGVGPTTTGQTTNQETSISTTSVDGTSQSTADDGPSFDVGVMTGGTDTDEPVDICKVNDNMDGLGPCRMKAPPDSFEPEVQWSFAGMPGEPDSIVTPLVANLTDDNLDGEIDLCDTPDILVVASPDWYQHGHMVLLDGATGSVHFQFTELSQWAVTPAIGDIDDDGIPEIVGSNWSGGSNYLAAWEHDGTLKWTSGVSIGGEFAIALADLDTDGDVEIIFGNKVTDHQGTLVFTAGDSPPLWSTTTAADLDDDGDMEVVMGKSAWHHDGSMLWNAAGAPSGMAHVADLDEDGLPEVLISPSSGQGLTLLEHDGTVKYTGINPTGDWDWRRPAAVHDLDGDNVSEIAVSSNANYGVYEGVDMSLLWVAPVLDGSGLASGTAFDFLGDGIAEAIYADESTLFVYGDNGMVLLQTPRSSGTLTEYPVVADVDNDGSAEIVVVSNEAFGNQTEMVQVIKDVEDRWIQARRIWNQHTYHVSNVREDGTIPQHEPKHWELLNTFRTNAQIEGGSVCRPEG